MNPLLWWTKGSRPLFGLFDLVSSKQARSTASSLEHFYLRRSQFATHEILHDIQLEKINQILHVAARIPFWQKYYNGDPVLYRGVTSLGELNRLPVLTRGAIRKYFPHQIVNWQLPKRRYYKEHTSGSTGEALEFFEDTVTIPGRIARYRRQRAWIEGVRNSSLIRLMNRERLGFWNEGRCLTVQRAEELDDALLRMYRDIEAESKKCPVFLESIASYLLRLAQLIQEHNLDRLNVTGLLVFGEGLAPAEVKFIEQTFSSKIIRRYSLRECSTVAQECGHSSADGGFHIVAEHFYVEVVDEKDSALGYNQPGTIVITSLDNTVMPFIRYNTGDRGCLISRKCSCGVNLPLLAIEGREPPPLRLNSNVNVSIKEMISVLSSLLFNAGQFQLIQKKQNVFVLQAVLFDQYAKRAFFDHIISSLKKVVREDIDIQVEVVSTIPLSKGGKRILFMSRQ